MITASSLAFLHSAYLISITLVFFFRKWNHQIDLTFHRTTLHFDTICIFWIYLNWVKAFKRASEILMSVSNFFLKLPYFSGIAIIWIYCWDSSLNWKWINVLNLLDGTSLNWMWIYVQKLSLVFSCNLLCWFVILSIWFDKNLLLY